MDRRDTERTLPLMGAGTEFLGRAVDAVFIDREETVWVGATTGLHRFRKPSIQVLPSQERFLGGAPAFAFVDSQDHVWISPAPNRGVSRVNVAVPMSIAWQFFSSSR